MQAQCPPAAVNAQRERSFHRRNWALSVSAACCVAIWACIWFQPDWLAAVTLVPAWFWLVPASVLTAFGISRKHKFRSLAVLIVWLTYTGFLVEEVESLVRTGNSPTVEWKAAYEQDRAFRVVSLNCSVANLNSAAEVTSFEPDIVLLQESPSRDNLQRLTKEHFGDDGACLWGGDTSIVAAGTIQPVTVDPTSHFVHATIELPSGVRVDVISVRLNPPVFRLDFWSGGFWNDHRDNRIKHRKQIADVMQRVQEIPESAHLIGFFGKCWGYGVNCVVFFIR